MRVCVRSKGGNVLTSRWEDVVDKQKDCLLRTEFHVLADFINKLAHRDVGWHKESVREQEICC